jgi:dTDP-4-amino-4,6-dideoxygalactose transaminase
LYEKLKQNNIYGRRYFYPLISEFSMYKGLDSAKPENLPVAEKMAKEVICLPIYPDLDMENINFVVQIIRGE